MARPSMAGQLREEILYAVEICILEKVIQATSLEYLAETAKMKRTILRHYIGNRDDIICALSARWSGNYQAQWEETLNWLPGTARLESLIDILFSPRSEEYVNNTIIGEALFSEAKRLEAVKQDQKKNMTEFINIVNNELTNQFAKSDKTKINLVAHGIHANYLMSESLLPLGMTDEIEQLKGSCKLLVTTLA